MFPPQSRTSSHSSEKKIPLPLLHSFAAGPSTESLLVSLFLKSLAASSSERRVVAVGSSSNSSPMSSQEPNLIDILRRESERVGGGIGGGGGRGGIGVSRSPSGSRISSTSSPQESPLDLSIA